MLVVDDDAAVRRLIAHALTAAGVEVLEAADAEQALRLLAVAEVGAVVLDQRLPGMSGRDLLARIRAEDGALPVLLVTGDVDVADRVGGLDAGADDYVTKPFEPDELVARVMARLRSGAVWRAVVDTHLRERAVLTEALGAVDPGAAPEAIAATICTELLRLPAVRGAAIVAFRGEGLAVTAAASGIVPWGLSPGGVLPMTLATYLGERAALGPWLERPPAVAAGPLAPPAACAPLEQAGVTAGLLVLATAAGQRGDHAAQGVLAAAIDVGHVVAVLLRPALTPGDQAPERRAALRAIAAEGRFTPVFQPVLRLQDLDVVGFEALSRFADGTEPATVFAEAAALGVGVEIELATLEAALDAAADLPAGAWLSCNVSPALVLAGTVLPSALARGGPDRRLVIELTEHDRVDDYGALRAALEPLRPRVGLSVDDAGSGFASLHHVLALGPDFVKLDRSWVQGVEHDPARQALIAGLGHFAVQTGSRLIAEGIETDSQLEVLRQLDAELGQGFLLGQPAPASAP